jgi:hypothetical protein
MSFLSVYRSEGGPFNTKQGGRHVAALSGKLPARKV